MNPCCNSSPREWLNAVVFKIPLASGQHPSLPSLVAARRNATTSLPVRPSTQGTFFSSQPPPTTIMRIFLQYSQRYRPTNHKPSRPALHRKGIISLQVDPSRSDDHHSI